MARKGFEDHARACMAELLRQIEQDPVQAHRDLDRQAVNKACLGVLLGVTVATVFFVALSQVMTL